MAMKQVSLVALLVVMLAMSVHDVSAARPMPAQLPGSPMPAPDGPTSYAPEMAPVYAPEMAPTNAPGMAPVYAPEMTPSSGPSYDVGPSGAPAPSSGA